MTTQICPYCHKEFKSTNSSQVRVFCSRKCSYVALKEKQRANREFRAELGLNDAKFASKYKKD